MQCLVSRGYVRVGRLVADMKHEDHFSWDEVLKGMFIFSILVVAWVIVTMYLGGTL